MLLEAQNHRKMAHFIATCGRAVMDIPIIGTRPTFLAAKCASTRSLLGKAFIPLQCKTIRVGSWCWLRPPMPQFCVGYLKVLKFALPPMQNPNVSQWNIGCVGSPTHNFRVGHVHFICFGVDFFRVGSRFSV